ADPTKIRLAFSGIRRISLDTAGDLVLTTDGDPILERKPHAYQTIDGIEKSVDVSYVIFSNYVKFNIGEYDKTKPLIIDPLLVYSTYFGGSGRVRRHVTTVDVDVSGYVN